jgi:tetratricopeptide (TPR) repeat protein
MLNNSKRTLFMAIITALFITACGGQNNKTASDKVIMPGDSSVVTAEPDTIQKGGAATLAVPQSAQNESSTSSIPPGGTKTGLKAASKAINQPPFEKSFLVKPNRPQEVSDGLKLAIAGDMPGAIAKFDEAIIKNPKDGEAYYFRAKAEIELNQSEKAMSDLNHAIEQEQPQALYYYYRGKLFSDSGDQDMAIVDFNNAIKLKNDFPEAYNYRGVAKAILLKHKEAIEDYDIGIKQNPKLAILYYNKGTSEAALKNYQGAIVTFTKSIELDAALVKAYLNRGNCRLMTNDNDGAIADFDKVITINPKSAEAYFNRGYAKYFGKKDGMCDDWRKALSLGHKEAAKMLEENCK